MSEARELIYSGRKSYPSSIQQRGREREGEGERERETSPP